MVWVKNVLQFINDNWSLIITIVGLLIALYRKVNNYLKLTNEEKVRIAIEQLRLIMLDLITEAEEIYKSKTGKLKRSYVFDKIYEKYAILKVVMNQEELEAKIDEIIDENLETLEELLNNSEEFYNRIYNNK